MSNRTRYEWVTLRVKKSEKDYLRREALERNKSMSDYLRALLFAAATFQIADGQKNP